MKFSKLAVAVGASLSVMLAGCDSPTTYTPEQVNSETRQVMGKEEQELKQALADAKAKDPTIRDMYYSVNDKGERELNIIREVKDPQTGQTAANNTVMPLLGGMAAGMLIGNMMNGGGFGGGYKPSYSYTRSYEDERRRKNSVTSAYTSHVRSNTVKSFQSKGYSKPSASSSSTRSTSVFRSGNSTRSAGYSSGG